LGWIDGLLRAQTGGAVGMATQLVVGAADESDRDIFKRIDQLYGEWNLKRVYYSSFHPVRYTPLEEHPPTHPMREHRLYQVDWLKRIYRFSNAEIEQAFDPRGFLPLDLDPKQAMALGSLDAFPLDVNAAAKDQLLRVPGIGPTSAQRILDTRRRHSIDTWRDLEAMGVVRKRAWPFIVFPGQRPPQGRQLRLALESDGLSQDWRHREPVRLPVAAASASPGAAPCGQARSCAGCPLEGMPGHPGAPALRQAPALAGV
jgi:predicted DNA-binding helix-hairpin-helix protein